MKIKKIDHIGVAVNNLEESLARWTELFGLKAGRVEAMPERGVKLAPLEPGKGPCLELISPLSEDSPVAKFLRERGEGIHHFCFKVKNIEEAMASLRKEGVSFLQERPVKGTHGSLIAFIHPRSFNGVLIELKQEKMGEGKSRDK